MVPLHFENGDLAVRIRADLVSDQPGNASFTDLVRLKLYIDDLRLTFRGSWGVGSQLTFLGSNGEDVTSINDVSTSMVEPTVGERSYLGLGGMSRFYRALPRGFVLYPGSLSGDIQSPPSMILDQTLIEHNGFCTQGSLFRIDRIFDQAHVVTDIVINNEQVEIDPYLNRAYYSIDINHRETNHVVPDISFDIIPGPVGSRLMNLLSPQLSSNIIPEYLDNCDLQNGNYPSIHFRVFRSPDDDQNFRGTIIYGPDDYLEPPVNGRCRFKIRNTGLASFGLNFLSKIAVHFDSRTIGFCDPA
jgi:hypothetical protein